MTVTARVRRGWIESLVDWKGQIRSSLKFDLCGVYDFEIVRKIRSRGVSGNAALATGCSSRVESAFQSLLFAEIWGFTVGDDYVRAGLMTGEQLRVAVVDDFIENRAWQNVKQKSRSQKYNKSYAKIKNNGKQWQRKDVWVFLTETIK